jgi:hypothetical protein
MKVTTNKRSSVRRKQRLDIFCFCRLRRKPVADEPVVGLRAAVFGRRTSHCDTTMNATRRPTTEADEPAVELATCPGCPGGVLPAPPSSRDTLFGRSSRPVAQIHGKKSKVSWVSCLFSKTIASVGGCACPGVCIRPVGGFSNQPGHPGHLRKVTMLTATAATKTAETGVLPETESAGTPQDPAGTPRGCPA